LTLPAARGKHRRVAAGAIKPKAPGAE
jgi:hypothetical protein